MHLPLAILGIILILTGLTVSLPASPFLISWNIFFLGLGILFLVPAFLVATSKRKMKSIVG